MPLAATMKEPARRPDFSKTRYTQPQAPVRYRMPKSAFERHPFKLTALMAAIPASGILGYFMMKLLVYFFPMSSGDIGTYFVVTLSFIVIGLTIPLLMLKMGLFAAHMGDAYEKEFRMRDIPKDKEQLNRER